MEITIFMVGYGVLDNSSIHFLVHVYTNSIRDVLMYQMGIGGNTEHETRLEIKHSTSLMIGQDKNTFLTNTIVVVNYTLRIYWPHNFLKSIAQINEQMLKDWEGYANPARLTKVSLGYLCSTYNTHACELREEGVDTLHSNYQNYDELIEDDLSCPYVVIDSPHTGVLFKDMLNEAKYNSLSFYLTKKGILHVCKNDFPRLLKALVLKKGTVLGRPFIVDAILTYSTFGISTVSLIAFIVIRFVEKRFLTIGGRNILALVFSLLVAQITFMVGIGVTDYPFLCQIIGIVLHALWTNVFSWMIICAFGIWRSFRSNYVNSRHNPGAFIKSIVLSMVFPSCIVAPMTVVHFMEIDAVDIHYGGSVCFLSTFQGLVIGVYIPVGIMLVATMSSFLHFVIFINKHANQTSAFIQNRNYLFLLVKISTLFGFGWSFGILANLFQLDPLWYTFYILTGLQGFFVTITFVGKSQLTSLRNYLRSQPSKFVFTTTTTTTPATRSQKTSSFSSADGNSG